MDLHGRVPLNLTLNHTSQLNVAEWTVQEVETADGSAMKGAPTDDDDDDEDDEAYLERWRQRTSYTDAWFSALYKYSYLLAYRKLVNNTVYTNSTATARMRARLESINQFDIWDVWRVFRDTQKSDFWDIALKEQLAAIAR